MARYEFKLEGVRRLRESHRDALRGQLADALKAAEKLQSQAENIETEISDLTELRRAESKNANFQVSRLLDAQRYEAQLRLDLRGLEEQAKQVEVEIQRRRELVVAAEREVRMLDILDERARQSHRQLMQRREQSELDETALVGWGRNRAQ